MSHLKRTLASIAIAVAVVASPAEGMAGDAVTVITFDREPEGPDAPRPPHGIFRDPNQDPSQQFITEEVLTEELPGGKKMDFLRLLYVCEATGAFNGWWCRIPAERADWRPHADKLLTVRLRTGKASPNIVKLEIKTEGGGVHPCYLRIGLAEAKEIEQKGYADVAVPLRDIVPNRDALARVTELVLVLLQDRLAPNARRGLLLLNSVRLVEESEARYDGHALSEELSHRAFSYFRDHTHPVSGLVRDRASNFEGRGTRDSNVASVSATGFYLSILPYAVKCGWMDRDQAEREAGRILRFATHVAHHRDGLFFHFMICEEGERWERSEVSCLDSAIFMNGVAVVSEAFQSVAAMADEILDRADWTKFLVEKEGKRFLSLGWSPERGLLGPLDVRTSETLMAYVLAIGSRSHPIDPDIWYNTSTAERTVAGYRVCHGELPLFVHQYGLLWMNPGGPDRDGIDLPANAVRAALANRRFCREIAAKRSMTYADCPGVGGWWGISAGDSADGYVAPGPIYGDADTVWPMAALASPGIALVIEEDLARWRSSRVWHRVLGKYGLAPFNLDTGWIGDDLIGIDIGAFLLNQAIHDGDLARGLFMRHPVTKTAIDRIGFAR
jgi:hypothetical protein